jgi:anti-sigma B factor antagonist
VSELSFDRSQDVLVAKLSGEIDIASAERLQGGILTEARSKDEPGLVVDLSGVEFLDSAGVRLLFTVHRAMTETGRPMAIVVPEGARIAKVLSIVDIASVVWTSPTLEGAIAKLFPPDLAAYPS